MASSSFKSLHKLLVIALYAFVVIGMMFGPSQNITVFQNIFILVGTGVAVSVLAAPRYFGSRVFFVFALYALILLLNYAMESYVNLGNILSESSTVIITSCMAYYLLKYPESKSVSPVIMWLFFVITGVYTIMTFVFSRTNPGIMRSAAMAYNEEIYHPYFLAGLSTYQFPHAISCLIPAYVLGLKEKNTTWVKIVAAALLMGTLVLIYITQATGALIVAVVALLLSIIAKIGNTRRNTQTILIISFFVLPLLLSSGIQSTLLGAAADLVGPESHYYSKIEELQESVSGVESGGGDVQTRGYLLEQTLNAIVNHPLFGVSDKSYGNHNALLDRWAEYGLIGFLPLIIGLLLIIKMTAKTIPAEIRSFYFIGVAASLLMMLTKSMFGWDQWFCTLVMLPILIKYFANQSFINAGYVCD